MNKKEVKRIPLKQKHRETTYLLNEWIAEYRKNIFKALNNPPTLEMAYFVGDFTEEERDKWIGKADKQREYRAFKKAYDRVLKLLLAFHTSGIIKTLRPEEIKTAINNYAPEYASKLKTVELKQDNSAKVNIILTNDGVNKLNNGN